MNDLIETQMPFATPGRFWRGDPHKHSTESYGAHAEEEACAAYAREGYDFVTMTGHFLPQYGHLLMDTRACQSDRFITLVGAELHQGRLGNGELWHIVAVGLPWDFAAPAEGETAEAICARAAAAGAFLAFAHPGWFALASEDVRSLPKVYAVEVYNHGTEIGQLRGDGWYLADIATDDMHWLGLGFGGGWTMVKATALTPEAILETLHAGQFYATQGPLIHDIREEGEAIVIDCSPVVTAALDGSRARRAGAAITEIASRVTLPLAGIEDGYFRVILRDRHERHAWTNPVWLS